MQGLKMMAVDESDLAIIAAQVQDATVKPDDIVWHAGTGQLSLAINRFAWDAETGKVAKRTRHHERRRALLSFARVTSVQSRAIKRDDPDQVLSLMTVQFAADAEGEPSGTVTLVFSGDSMLRLNVECIEARLADTGAAWETRFKPRHPLG